MFELATFLKTSESATFLKTAVYLLGNMYTSFSYKIAKLKTKNESSQDGAKNKVQKIVEPRKN